MKVRCLYNTGAALMQYARKPLGTSEQTEFGLLEVSKEYLVMGMIMGEGVLEYLIDDGGVISTCPYQLFEVIDSSFPNSWHFRAFVKEDAVYPYQEAIWGYTELCFDDDHFEKLIEEDEQAHQTYFKRKIEIEDSLV